MLDIFMIGSNLIFLFIGYYFGTKAIVKDVEVDKDNAWRKAILGINLTKEQETEAFVAEE